MGKRSSYEKIPRDYYPTPEKAVLPLLGHLPKEFTFCEPCAGDGRLALHLEKLFDAMCLLAIDVEPKTKWTLQGEAEKITEDDLVVCDFVVTNPPFTWNVVKPILDNLIPIIPSVMLLPADWLHNQRFAPYLAHAEKVVSIGRVQWIEGSKSVGVDNYMWVFFTPEKTEKVEFVGRK